MSGEPPGTYDLERMLKGSTYEAMLRAAIIEECARAMESHCGFSEDEKRIAAAAIRALKDEP